MRHSTAGHRPVLRRAVLALGVAMALLAGMNGNDRADAQGVALANYDLQASGFVTPAGMPPIGSPASAVMPVGYNAYGCDTGACDGMSMMGGVDQMRCGTCGGGGGCGCNGLLGGGGLLGKMRSGGGAPCLFCRGAGCTACRELPFGYVGSCLASAFDLMRPYEEAGICNQRWYDLSLEGLFLDRNIGGGVPGTITTQGVAGTPVLTLNDVGADDLEAGVRVSAALIMGPGGNLEGTYMGGNEWSGTASYSSANPDLYSFISEFGTNPPDNNTTPQNDAGYDDTDRSFSQGLVARSEFHSVELNYRRRTMFPYCRFQSSWLVGLRYMRYDDSLIYTAVGDNNNTAQANLARFFQSDSSTKNNLFGPQAGFDFWWNVMGGVSVGIGSKAAWVQNDVDRRTQIAANSLGIGATPGSGLVVDSDQDTTVIADFELKGVYRFSHSFSLRASYYILTVEDIAFGGLDRATVTNILTTSNVNRPFVYDTLDLQGFTVGAEYVW